jgi:hypothetical protein
LGVPCVIGPGSSQVQTIITNVYFNSCTFYVKYAKKHHVATKIGLLRPLRVNP